LSNYDDDDDETMDENITDQGQSNLQGNGQGNQIAVDPNAIFESILKQIPDDIIIILDRERSNEYDGTSSPFAKKMKPSSIHYDDHNLTEYVLNDIPIEVNFRILYFYGYSSFIIYLISIQ
jgi:hypothetical protein